MHLWIALTSERGTHAGDLVERDRCEGTRASERQRQHDHRLFES
jgi:hypothetical protein